MNHQPFDATRDPDALLRRRTVEQMVGLSCSVIYARVKAGTFPAPLKLGPRCVRWQAGVVREWIARQAEKAVRAEVPCAPPKHRRPSAAARALLSEAA